MKEIIFAIFDKYSGARVTPLLTASNKLVAINTFRQFSQEEEKKGLDRRLYQLIYLGYLNNNRINVLPAEEVPETLDGADIESSLKLELMALDPSEADL